MWEKKTQPLTFVKNNNIKVKGEVDGKINVYSRHNDCNFKKFATIHDEEISNLLKKGLILL